MIVTAPGAGQDPNVSVATHRSADARVGKEGSASIVRQVEEIEKMLGIYELSQFTPGAVQPT